MPELKYEFHTEPYPHQKEFFDRFKFASYVAELADMGVGKTKMTIDILAFRYFIGDIDRAVVIAPNGVHAQWLDEQFPEHCGYQYEGLVYSSKKTNKVLREQDRFFYNAMDSNALCVLAINVESFARPKGQEMVDRLFKTSSVGTCIIVDEASCIKTPDIKTTKNIKKVREKWKPSLVMALTGTPAAKGPVNLWSIYDYLKKGYMGCSYIAFKMMHTVTFNKTIHLKGRTIQSQEPITKKLFDTVKREIKGRLREGCLDDDDIEMLQIKYGLSNKNFWHIYNNNRYSKFKNIPKLLEKIAPDTFSISKKDCLELPPKVKESIYFDLNPEQNKLINQLKKYSLAMYEGEELTLEIKALLGLRILQICGGFFSHHTDIEGKFDVKPIKGKNAKLEYIKRDLEEVGDQQAIIWAVYTPEINLLTETLRKEYAVGRLDGLDTNPDNRRDLVNAFKRGHIQHLIAHPAVGGMGYNFQNASIQYWYSRNYRTQDRIQAEERIYRIGTENSPVYKDLMYNLEFEQIVYDTVNSEMDINSLFITHDFEQVEKNFGKDLTIKDLFAKRRV